MMRSICLIGIWRGSDERAERRGRRAEPRARTQPFCREPSRTTYDLRPPTALRPPPSSDLMPRRTDISKILVLGSGPIVIGQAAEFDYSGVQACKVLLEEGYEVVLVNSNPATIMTDP